VPAANGKYDDGVGLNFLRWSESSFGLRCRVESDVWLALIREHVDRHAWAKKGSVKIVPKALDSSTALLDALPLLRGRA